MKTPQAIAAEISECPDHNCSGAMCSTLEARVARAALEDSK